MKKYACIYARVSTEEKQNTRRQITELTQLAEKMGYIVDPANIYTENISGFSKKENRLALLRMLEDVTSSTSKPSMIFMSEVSRLARDPVLGRRIMDDLCEKGIGMYFQNIGQCSITPTGERNSIFHMMFQLLIEVSKVEADNTKSRSKSGMRQSAIEGKQMGGLMIPYGYRRENKMLVIDEEEAKIVQDIFHHVLDGLGTTTIANLLNDQNVPTRVTKIKSGKLKDVQKIWVDKTVTGIVRNTIYIGKKKYQELVLAAPAIVDERVWIEANQILLQRGANHIKESKYLYLLNNLAKCGICSRSYFGRFKPPLMKNGKIYNWGDKYYMCLSRRYKHVGNCGNKGISIEALESLVVSVLCKDSWTQMGEYLEQTSYQVTSTKKEVEKLEVHLLLKEKMEKQKRKEINKIISVFFKDGLSEDDFIHLNGKLTKQLHNIRFEINQLKQTIEAKNTMIREHKTFDRYWTMVQDWLHDRHRLKEILPHLLKKVVINAVTEKVFRIGIFLKGGGCIPVVFDKEKLMYNRLHGLTYTDDGCLSGDVHMLVKAYTVPQKYFRKVLLVKFDESLREAI